MKYIKKSGQISAMMLTVIGLLFSASSVISWNAFNKADKANEEVSNVRESVAEIRTDVKWIREALSNQKVLGTTTTSTKYNGHK